MWTGCWGTSLRFTLPSSALESWNTTSLRGVDAFEPVANLHRYYLRQNPVFLRSLLRLAGRKIDRRFYFSRLLPGTQRGRAGPGCLLIRPAAQQLLGKVGLLHTAAATGAKQRAASAAATAQCRTHWPIYALCPAKRRGIVSTPTLPTSSQVAA